ncbi:MAG: hypothetical protein LUO88_02170 [Methanoregulaceae archaeon]|nr:hypothetical protein [Methanoregulaceae archaeon]
MKQPTLRMQVTTRNKIGFFRLLPLLAIAVVIAGCTTPAGPVVLIDYHRTGGIAGFNDHLVIYSNGNATVTRNTGAEQFTMTPAEIRNLEGLFENAGFMALNSSYPPSSPGADYFTYIITYHGKTVTTEDTGVPEALAPVISTLNGIVSSHSG